MRHFVLALSVTFFLTVNTKAQNANKTHFIMLSIHAGRDAHQPEVIVTKEDGTQEITKAHKGSWMWNSMTFDDIHNGRIEENEDSLFQILKPYFDAGWQLASSTIIHNLQIDDYIARYYFTKKDD